MNGGAPTAVDRSTSLFAALDVIPTFRLERLATAVDLMTLIHRGKIRYRVTGGV